MSDRFPFPAYPSGWFRIAGSTDVRPGQIKTVHYFGRDLVLFRSRQGHLGVFGAHCPHLGAHLGLGKVVNDNLQCAFHGWQFNSAGKCVSIPGGRRIPARMAVDLWPVSEVNGQVMIYFHPAGEPPSWQFPKIAEVDDPAWSRFFRGPRREIRSSPQEILENNMDLSHFSFLHKQQTISAETLALEPDGPVLVHRTLQHYNIFKPARRLAGGKVSGPLDVYLYGLGLAVIRTTVDAGIKLGYTYQFYLTPIDEEHVELTAFMAVKRFVNRAVTYLLVQKGLWEGRRTVDQDIPIWESKAYVTRPRLAEGDGRIMPYRRWAEQFYHRQADRSLRDAPGAA